MAEYSYLIWTVSCLLDLASETLVLRYPMFLNLKEYFSGRAKYLVFAHMASAFLRLDCRCKLDRSGLVIQVYRQAFSPSYQMGW